MHDPDDMINSYNRAKPNRWVTCLVVMVILVIFLAVLAYYLGGQTENVAEQPGNVESVDGVSLEENDG